MEDRMSKVWTVLRGLYYGGDERGQTLTEYALILVLVVIGAIVVMGAFGIQVNALYQKALSEITTAAG
jgi:Flp pilus assembly pilin Flp